MDIFSRRLNIKSIFIILVIVASLAMLFLSSRVFKTKTTIEYSIDGKIYTLLTAKTPREKSQGLSRLILEEGESPLKKFGAEGMIFYFNPPQPVIFWNHETYLDPTLYWIRDSQVIGTTSLLSIANGQIVLESPATVDAVIEVIRTD